MATLIEMQDITRYERAYGRKRHHAGSVTDATSDALVVPVDADTVTIGVTPGTNATVQVTASSYAEIEADTAVWYDWSAGTVSAATLASIEASIVALRMTSTGTSTWQVSA